MSTRATYLIDGQPFYIHYDGYEAGAAGYFAAATACENHRGGFSHMFFRANELCEITEGHEAHGDTEYRYTYSSQKDTLKVEKRTAGSTFDKIEFMTAWTGSLAAFLNANTEPDGSGHPQWLRAFGRTLKRNDVRDEARKRMNAAWMQYARGWTGNAGSALDDLKRGLDATGLSLTHWLGREYEELDGKLKERFAQTA